MESICKIEPSGFLIKNFYFNGKLILCTYKLNTHTLLLTLANALTLQLVIRYLGQQSIVLKGLGFDPTCGLSSYSIKSLTSGLVVF